MKRNRILAWLLVLCLCLGACGQKSQTPEGESTPSSGSPDPSIPTVTRGPMDLGKTVDFELAGKRMVPYTVNMSVVRYIDAPEKLPDHEELAQYDAAWFEDHALLLIYETVRSTATEVGIESILLEDGCAQITLTHTPKAAQGTTVMTTWLLWAEVDAGLVHSWNVTNPMVENETSDR